MLQCSIEQTSRNGGYLNSVSAQRLLYHVTHRLHLAILYNIPPKIMYSNPVSHVFIPSLLSGINAVNHPETPVYASLSVLYMLPITHPFSSRDKCSNKHVSQRPKLQVSIPLTLWPNCVAWDLASRLRHDRVKLS